MAKRVYGLKRATPKMKYQHMRMVMDWKADLAEKQQEFSETGNPVGSCGHELTSRPLFMVGKTDLCFACYESYQEQATFAAQWIAEQTKANERASAEYVRMMESKEQTLAGWNSLVQQYAPKQLTAANPETCDHKREYAVKSGIQCSSCRQVREPANDFEKRLVSRLMPRDSGYVNYRF